MLWDFVLGFVVGFCDWYLLLGFCGLLFVTVLCWWLLWLLWLIRLLFGLFSFGVSYELIVDCAVSYFVFV